MAQTPDDRISTALALISQARQEGRAGGLTRQAAEAFLFLIEDLGFHVAGVDYHSYRDEESIRFASRDVVVGISWSAVDPVQVTLCRPGRGLMDLRELVPLSVRGAYDDSRDDKDFAQVAGFVKQWAGQRLQSETGGGSEGNQSDSPA